MGLMSDIIKSDIIDHMRMTQYMSITLLTSRPSCQVGMTAELVLKTPTFAHGQLCQLRLVPMFLVMYLAVTVLA